MLLSFRFKNFRSFRDEQEFSMVASNLKGPTEPLIETGRKDLKVLPVAAVYGANASGKTNFLNALDFMAWAVRESFRSWTPGGGIPVEQFKLDTEGGVQAMRFEVDLLLDAVRFQYGFRLDPSRILEEWLYAFPEGRRQLWFSREHGDRTEQFKFGKNLTGPNQSVREVTRENSLFLSAAAQNNHGRVFPVYHWFAHYLDVICGSRADLLRDSTRCSLGSGSRQPLMEFLAAADPGITNVEFEDEPAGIQRLFRFPATIHEASRPHHLRAVINSAPSPGEVSPKGSGLRPGRTTLPGVPRITFSHSTGVGGAEVKFGIEEESEGTRAILALAVPIVLCLERGSVLLVDELEASLHPLLAREVIRLFSRRESNPRGAQLIFNTHDTNLLDPDLLRRDQIWFCEKDREGASRLYPLSDFRPRRMENVERGYLQGRYGAIPFLGDLIPSLGESSE